MTGYGLIASFIWAAVAVLFLFVASTHVDQWFDLKADHSRVDEEIVVPDDLAALALGETEEWAQSQVMKVIRERYAEYGNWNKVRAAMGVGLRDE